jgi:hypothetical protein
VVSKLDYGAVEFAPDAARCLGQFQAHHPFDLDGVAAHLIEDYAQPDAGDRRADRNSEILHDLFGRPGSTELIK